MKQLWLNGPDLNVFVPFSRHFILTKETKLQVSLQPLAFFTKTLSAAPSIIAVAVIQSAK